MTNYQEILPGRLRMAAGDSLRFGVIALIAFLTLVDLFAAQAILPSLVKKFEVSRAAMGFAVNACTFGMAIAGLTIALFGRNIDRRDGIGISLVLLSIPTVLLSMTDNITVFALLRIAQGLFMSAAFTLTVAYLAEHFSPAQSAGALAAYVTGNVASNFFGRILSAAVADSFGISINFLTFAALNIAGALLVWVTFKKNERMMIGGSGQAPAGSAWKAHLVNGELRRSFAIGFLILFVFIGTFTYVNFQLAAPPLALSPMALGLVYFVFLPSLLTTPLAGLVAGRLGASRGIGLTLGFAIAGLLALCRPCLPEWL
jgi:predicted MFS family arabinose efflux permease